MPKIKSKCKYCHKIIEDHRLNEMQVNVLKTSIQQLGEIILDPDLTIAIMSLIYIDTHNMCSDCYKKKVNSLSMQWQKRAYKNSSLWTKIKEKLSNYWRKKCKNQEK